MAVTRTERTGFFGNLKNSIITALIGVLLFFASFVLIYMTAGRTNWAKLAETAEQVEAGQAGGHDGQLIAITGELGTDETLGDDQFIAPGAYIELNRSVEVYACVEHTETETRDKVGGGTETITTYTYRMEWVSAESLPNPSNYEAYPEARECDGLHSYPAQLEGDSFEVSTASVGEWTFRVSDAQLPGGESLSLDQAELINLGQSGTRSGNYIYLYGADPNTTRLGDHRVSFTALRPGLGVTIFGAGDGSSLVGFEHEGKRFLRALRGEFNDAISSLKTEFAVLGIMGYVGGFFMMWFGMSMVFAPLHAIAGILPFLKKASSFIVSLITFPIALVLTLITMLISNILQSPIALAIVGVLVIGGAVYLYKNRRKDDGPAAPPGPPPGGGFGGGGMPPGPPPGGGFGGMPPGAPPAGPMAGTPPGPPPGGMPPGPPPA